MLWRGRKKEAGIRRGAAAPSIPEEKMLGRAGRRARSGRQEAAGRVCDGILEENPGCAPAMELKAVMALDSCDLKGSQQWYGRAIRARPGHSGYLSSKAAVLNMRGKTRAAMKRCGAALDLDPRNEYAMSERCLALKNRGRFDEALQWYDRVLASSPDSMVVVANKGVALMMKGMYEEAIACYDRAISADSRDAAAIFNKAVALARMGRREESLRHLGRAVALGLDGAGAMAGKVLNFVDASEEERAAVMRGVRGAENGPRRAGMRRKRRV